MKAKLFAILGLIITIAGMSLALSSPVEAKGEKYRWIDKDTVEASGGLYTQVTAAQPKGVINFTRASGFKITSKGACDITMTIVPSVDNASGTLTTKGCDEQAKDFDRSFTISDVDKGPPVGTNPGTPTTDTGTDDTKATSCAISGIGWIVCPVVSFLSKVVDGAYSVVSALMLVQPLVTTNQDGKSTAIYQAWSVMRNIANVAFVIAFLFIIFSQITSIGITNYGIKKMLPRLIISAVLVNVSFWVCAAAVDLSNIAGSSIRDVFKGIGASMSLASDYSDSQTGGGWAGIAGGLLAGTGATVALLYIGLSALLPMLLAALIAIIIALLVLALRQALIVVLIIVAPIAFVLRLLPNTESLYKKWQSMGSALLIGFPGIALLFGGSELASQIITSTAKGNKLEFVIQIMGAGVAVVPLAVTPFIIKAAGVPANLVSKLQGATGKGPIASLKKGAEGYRSNRQQLRDARALNGGARFGGSLVRRKARREAVLGQRARNYNKAKTGYIANESLSGDVSRTQRALAWATLGDLGGKTKGEQLLNQMEKGGGPGARSVAESQAISTQRALQAEEIKAHHATIDDLDKTKLMDEINNSNNSDTKIAAAIEQLIKIGDMSQIEEVVNAQGASGKSSVITRSLADALNRDGPKFLKASDIGKIARGQMKDDAGQSLTLSEITSKNIEDGALSQEKMADSNPDQLKYASANTTAAGHAQLQATARDLKANDSLKGKIKQNRDSIDSLEATGQAP